YFFFQAEDGIRDFHVTGVQTCALPILVRDETLRRFCDSSDDNMRWLESHGVQFGSSVYTGKSIYPPEGYDIYFSGNEKVTSSARSEERRVGNEDTCQWPRDRQKQ